TNVKNLLTIHFQREIQMENLRLLALGGLLAASVSTHASFLSLPETLHIDINTDWDSYTFDYTYSFDDANPETYVRPIINFYRAGSENFHDEFDDGSFDPVYGLAYLFQGGGYLGEAGKQRIERPVL